MNSDKVNKRQKTKSSAVAVDGLERDNNPITGLVLKRDSIEASAMGVTVIIHAEPEGTEFRCGRYVICLKRNVAFD